MSKSVPKTSWIKLPRSFIKNFKNSEVFIRDLKGSSKDYALIFGFLERS